METYVICIYWEFWIELRCCTANVIHGLQKCYEDSKMSSNSRMLAHEIKTFIWNIKRWIISIGCLHDNLLNVKIQLDNVHEIARQCIKTESVKQKWYYN